MTIEVVVKHPLDILGWEPYPATDTFKSSGMNDEVEGLVSPEDENNGEDGVVVDLGNGDEGN